MKYRAIPAGRDDDLADVGGNRTVPVGCRHHEVSVSVLVDVSGAADRLPQVVESTGSGVGIQERPIETGVDPYPAGFGKGIVPTITSSYPSRLTSPAPHTDAPTRFPAEAPWYVKIASCAPHSTAGKKTARNIAVCCFISRGIFSTLA